MSDRQLCNSTNIPIKYRRNLPMQENWTKQNDSKMKVCLDNWRVPLTAQFGMKSLNFCPFLMRFLGEKVQILVDFDKK
jgi:hypothetical protein